MNIRRRIINEAVDELMEDEDFMDEDGFNPSDPKYQDPGFGNLLHPAKKQRSL